MVGVAFDFDPLDPVLVGVQIWWLFLLLLPFAAVGVSILMTWLLMLCEPFRVTTLSFTPAWIQQRTTRLGLPFGRKQEYSNRVPLTVNLRDRLGPSDRGFESLRRSTAPTGAHYGLLLTSEDREEVFTLRGLTLGEARWIKGRLQEQGYATVSGRASSLRPS